MKKNNEQSLHEPMSVYGLDLNALKVQSVNDVMQVSDLKLMKKLASTIRSIVQNNQDEWFDDPSNVQNLQKGIQQIEEGLGKEYSLEEIKEMLG